MDPGQPIRLRKKNRSSRLSVFGVFKFARRAPQSPMPAFAGASAARGARSRRRLVPTILGGFAGQSRRSPLERSDPTRVLFFPLPVNSTWPDQSSGLRRLETEFRGFCISCRLTPSRPARPSKAPAPPWRVTCFPSPPFAARANPCLAPQFEQRSTLSGRGARRGGPTQVRARAPAGGAARSALRPSTHIY